MLTNETHHRSPSENELLIGGHISPIESPEADAQLEEDGTQEEHEEFDQEEEEDMVVDDDETPDDDDEENNQRPRLTGGGSGVQVFLHYSSLW